MLCSLCCHIDTPVPNTATLKILGWRSLGYPWLQFSQTLHLSVGLQLLAFEAYTGLSRQVEKPSVPLRRLNINLVEMSWTERSGFIPPHCASITHTFTQGIDLSDTVSLGSPYESEEHPGCKLNLQWNELSSSQNFFSTEEDHSDCIQPGNFWKTGWKQESLCVLHKVRSWSW